ncbi:hypothetical protein QEZ54_23515 [Catellatospora sp. KI3]|uniref:hypothetical protein n=1 Tax=Catellatospora sp. KI3 TaxID=3041620 RepID=UPI0024832B46|nr:hypothetical protein [Catellatospora sp. KI3]MDI1463958.1 hypothetical protein [Catellatospora sp. KI3]
MSIGDRMTLRNLYLYLVCLITLIISIFAAVSLVRGTVELLYPDPGYGYYGVPDSKMSAEEQRKLEQQAKDSQHRNSVLGLVSSGTMLLIAVPVYIYHWRRIQSELPARPAVTTGEPPTTP